GLLVAGSVHTVKAAAVRPAVTATTAGAGNIPVSIAEDVIATITSVLAILIPLIAGTLFIIFLVLVLWWWASRKQKAQSA
ncbi:MAG TPA: DUF4126 domain-containing protein, partial [Anaerolineales bacterium]|nr:DUF4126 domain-containing protein [Anaerolineales bacterium]